MTSDADGIADDWYYSKDGQAHGPLRLAEFMLLLERAHDPRSVLIWRPGFAQWTPVREVSEIADRIWKQPPLPPADSPSTLDEPLKIREPVALDPGDAEYFKSKKLMPQPAGIGGWLYLVGFGQVVGILRLIGSIGDYYKSIDAHALQEFPVTMFGEMAMNAGLFGLLGVSTILFFRKSRLFPRFFIYQWLAIIGLPILNALWVGITLGLVTGEPSTQFMQWDTDQMAQTVGGMVAAAVWGSYILRSRRVANTFTR